MGDYDTAVAAWKANRSWREKLRPDGVPTRIDRNFMSDAELAIMDAITVVEAMGASAALTDAVVLLGKARDHVADHVENTNSGFELGTR